MKIILILILIIIFNILGIISFILQVTPSSENFQIEGGMELLLPVNTSYEKQIKAAIELKGEHSEDVTFHAYWYGDLNEKHLISIRSCYCFNVMDKSKRKIILWLENNESNEYNREISKYADIKTFDFEEEVKGTFLQDKKFYLKRDAPSFYSDRVRYLLLLKYGGCWFDLDIIFFRSIDPIFANYGDRICLFAWERQNYPNGALYISLQKNSNDMISNLEYIIKRKKGFGFQEGHLTYDKPLKMFILPCSWIDPAWIKNPLNFDFSAFFKDSNKEWTLDNFFPGTFGFHWHNRWSDNIEPRSVCRQLDTLILNKILSNVNSHS